MNKRQEEQFKRTLARKQYSPSYKPEAVQVITSAVEGIVSERKAMWYLDFFDPLKTYIRDGFERGEFYRHYNIRDNYKLLTSKELMIRHVQQMVDGKIRYSQEQWQSLQQEAEKKSLSLEEVVCKNEEARLEETIINFFNGKTIGLLNGVRRSLSQDETSSFYIDNVRKMLRKKLMLRNNDTLYLIMPEQKGKKVCSAVEKLHVAMQLLWGKRYIFASSKTYEMWEQEKLRKKFGSWEDTWDKINQDITNGVIPPHNFGAIFHSFSAIYRAILRDISLAYTDASAAMQFLGKFVDLSVYEGRNVFVNVTPKKKK